MAFRNRKWDKQDLLRQEIIDTQGNLNLMDLYERWGFPPSTVVKHAKLLSSELGIPLARGLVHAGKMFMKSYKPRKEIPVTRTTGNRLSAKTVKTAKSVESPLIRYTVECEFVFNNGSKDRAYLTLKGKNGIACIELATVTRVLSVTPSDQFTSTKDKSLAGK